MDFIPKKINIVKKNIEKIDSKNNIQKITPQINKTPIFEETAYIPSGVINTVVDVSTNLVKDAVDVVVPGAGKIISAVAPVITNSLTGIRLKNLPEHDEDFATSWYYSSISTLNPDNITIEYNAYLQALDELKSGKIEMPSGVDGPTIGFDLDTHILHDFRTKEISYSPDDNLVHRAWFAHCAKRAIDSLRDGEFIGTGGYIGKYPEIAKNISRRIDQIIVQNTLYKTKTSGV